MVCVSWYCAFWVWFGGTTAQTPMAGRLLMGLLAKSYKYYMGCASDHPIVSRLAGWSTKSSSWGIVASRTIAWRSFWRIWISFCRWKHITFDPFICSCFGLKRVIQGCVQIDLYNFDIFYEPSIMHKCWEGPRFMIFLVLAFEWPCWHMLWMKWTSIAWCSWVSMERVGRQGTEEIEWNWYR